ncbi:MAG TPA: phosphoglycolate phosphatase [Steroidobacteraceae bacterium]
MLYDLDGTLLDTVADITLALNRAVLEHGWEPLPESSVRRMIGRGSEVLVQRAAQAQQRTLDAAGMATVLERFLHHYAALERSQASTARAYPGVPAALQRLKQAGLRSAVITNKHREFALALLERLGLSPWIDLIVGGDSCERRKPDPQPLQFACASLELAASAALMVGDSINDVQAAQAAGIAVICVTYGYNEGQDPRALACDAHIDGFDELPGLLLARS